MALDDPIILLAFPALVLLIIYQFYNRGKSKKRNALQTLGFVVLTLGLILFILVLDFVTAFIFISVGVLFIMVGEFAARLIR